MIEGFEKVGSDHTNGRVRLERKTASDRHDIILPLQRGKAMSDPRTHQILPTQNHKNKVRFLHIPTLEAAQDCKSVKGERFRK